MTPAARIAAAIDILDAWCGGVQAEAALTRWGQKHRFAGSGDRAAIRDIVYRSIRCRASHGWLGGGNSGRALMIGQLRADGRAPEEVFTGDGYAPAQLSDDELPGRDLDAADPAIRLDCPSWLWPQLSSYGPDRDAILATMQQRAPIFLRANLLKCDRAAAIAALAAAGIEARPHALSATALEVAPGTRGLQATAPFRDGLVDLQDAASQAVVDFACPRPGEKVLDYCAGGGGKTLALAALTKTAIVAHDADPARMRDLPDRAARAGADVVIAATPAAAAGPYDLVFCDAPCSGSGSWRRDPEGKWRLTADRLNELTQAQTAILDAASALVAPGGRLAYATCSLLPVENEDRISAFLADHPGWEMTRSRQFTPIQGGDGFFVAVLARRPGA